MSLLSNNLTVYFLNSNEPSQRPFDYPLLLSTDPLSPSRYFCSHKAGVHSINLPMVAQLAELAQSPDDLVTKGHLPSPIEQNSIIQHLGWDFVKKISQFSEIFSDERN